VPENGAQFSAGWKRREKGEAPDVQALQAMELGGFELPTLLGAMWTPVSHSESLVAEAIPRETPEPWASRRFVALMINAESGPGAKVSGDANQGIETARQNRFGA